MSYESSARALDLSRSGTAAQLACPRLQIPAARDIQAPLRRRDRHHTANVVVGMQGRGRGWRDGAGGSVHRYRPRPWSIHAACATIRESRRNTRISTTKPQKYSDVDGRIWGMLREIIGRSVTFCAAAAIHALLSLDEHMACEGQRPGGPEFRAPAQAQPTRDGHLPGPQRLNTDNSQ